MKRKLVALLTVSSILSSLLTGCAASDNEAVKEQEEVAESTVESQEEAEETQPEEAEPAGDPDKVVLTLIHLNETGDVEMVQDAVNEITIPDINVEVEFKPVTLTDSFTNYSLWISSGETVDLMCLLAQNVNTYVDSGLIEPLTDLITPETTPTLAALGEEYPILKSVGEDIYAVQPVSDKIGSWPGVVMDKTLFEETGYEEKEIYTNEDLTAIFAAIKEKHPDCYPLSPSGIGLNNADISFPAGMGVGSSLAGVQLSKDSDTLVNLYETDLYKNHLAQLAEWYEAGYILPDIATTELSDTELLTNGKIACFYCDQDPIMSSPGNGIGADLVCLPTGVPRLAGSYDTNTYFTVPVTSSSPEAALRLLDYIYENKDLTALIFYGIEGVHYEVVDEEKRIIKYLDGVDIPTYNLTYGVWGDRRNEYKFSDLNEAYNEYNEAAKANEWIGYGFVFDNTSVINQIQNCQAVLDEYSKALETGALGAEWEATYEDMVSQLQNAGIEDIIAECQSQFDAFLEK